MKTNRIEILDGFRALAILAVILYHFFSRWTPPLNDKSLYPYNDDYSYFTYGSLGVQFFFIISGFVISFTLDNTNTIQDFWKKRTLRLLPSIVTASLITFILCSLFDNQFLFPNSHEIKNFLPSITFISPNLINHFYNTDYPGFQYINGSYWSLWPEIQFYVFVSIIYFSNKTHFFRNITLASLFVIFIKGLFENIQGNNLMHITLSAEVLDNYNLYTKKIFNLVLYMPFFCLGVVFYYLFKNKEAGNKIPFYTWILLTFLFINIIYAAVSFKIRFAYFIMFLLFLGFIYVPGRMKFFEQKIFTKIGINSYFLYLIHENIGVLFISLLGSYFLPFGFVFPLLLIVFFILFSIFYTEKIEKRIVTSFKKRELLDKGIKAQSHETKQIL